MAGPPSSAGAITEAEIIEMADAIARSDGFDALTIRRLCAELGVTAPAIYRRFENKDAIVTETVDRILARTTLPDADDLDWAECVAFSLLSTHDEVAPYPGLGFLISKRLPLSPAGLRNEAYIRGVMTAAGLTRDEREIVQYMLFTYIWGHLLVANAIELPEAEDRRLFLDGLEKILGVLRRDYGPGKRARRTPP